MLVEVDELHVVIYLWSAGLAVGFVVLGCHNFFNIFILFFSFLSILGLYYESVCSALRQVD